MNRLLEAINNYRQIIETIGEGVWIGDPQGRTIFVNQKMADMLGYTREEMIGKMGLEFVETGRHDLLETSSTPLAGTSIPREIKFYRKDGGVIWTKVNFSPLFDDTGKCIGNLLMHSDITERKHLEEALQKAKAELEWKVAERTLELQQSHQELLQSEQQLLELFEVMAEGAIYLSADGKIVKINPVARRILGLEGISLENYQYSESGWSLWTTGFSSLRSDGTPMPPEERTVVRVFKEKKALENQEMGVKRPDGSIIWLNTSAAPLLNKRGALSGVINTFIDITEQKTLRDEKNQFTVKLLQVQEEERKRISRELHDGTAQYLALLSLEMDVLIQKEKQLPVEIISRLERLRGTVDNALREVRRFAHEMRPDVLEELGLTAAVELIINEFNTLGVARVEFEATGSDKRLPDETELALFRITQEALNNIRKHSKASSARVTLEYTESKLRLKITDNGVGFADFKKSSFDKKSGLGLLGMRERAQLVSATLTIDSSIGKGTTVCVEVPCV